ncbi:MAG: TatD family hydrolase, partial [Candidatus Pacebacteria bacterium]|nr:TatD family hydrolase [Candidatus Paceibacterota bacterium]
PVFFDIHSHLNDASFNDDRREAILRLQDKNTWTITVGVDKKMSQKACEMTLLADGLFASVGMHPTDNMKENFSSDFYRGLAEKYPKVVAIGECGLDYFRIPLEKIESEKKRQKELFEKHIELAIGLDKPLMIHCRSSLSGRDGNAYQDIIEILVSKKREYGEKLRGNIHFFADSVETAKKYFELDFTISFTGVITFTTQYNDVVAYAPLRKILSETDAPYVAPVPYRGKRCEPIYVEKVVKKIAEIRAESPEAVQNILVDNAFRVFNIKSKQ